MDNIFDRSKHVYNSVAFEEIIKDTIRFFNGTPVHKLPPPEKFTGTGVYALYYIGKSSYYQVLYNLNRIEFKQPIYIGKAVPRGWRQSRKASSHDNSYELYQRLCDHTKSIVQANNLDLNDFHCRFMILENAASDLIGTVEAALIRHYTPVWNSSIDGFGNHNPGKGRYNQAKSEWDILHPGRQWAYKCKGEASTLVDVENKVRRYLMEGKND
ncbi:MAG TPA: Eco29kI family restriction endonuclease [Candidatus Avimuribaculum pullicola]|nr:Eco29kI family restriction endonuclease [Candidatus Avimuribaculum pullicola]